MPKPDIGQIVSHLMVIGFQHMSRVGIDLRDALRGLRTGRGTTLLAFGILSVTMAAGTVIFSVVDGVALRPLPYASPDQLVGISSPSATPGQVLPANPRDYFGWLEGTRTLESLGATRFGSLQFQRDGVGETLRAGIVTANLFDVLGVRPEAGRFFGREYERPGGPTGVILSHDLWRRRFRADPGVIGRLVTFDQGPREVLGVLPAGVSYPITAGPPPDIYVPYVITAAERSNNRCCLFVVGRLRRGVGIEQARADIQRLSSAVVLPLHDQVVGPAQTSMLLVLAAVGFVLLVACVNVANLLLARAATRVREFSAREALGASRRRLAIGLLLEGLILALVSAAVGVVLSIWSVELTKSILPPGLARVSAIAVDGRVLSVSIAAAVLCGLVFASAPAWLTSRTDLVGLMKASGGSVIGGRRRERVLSAFLIADVAFVCVLLVATTLVVTSFVKISTMDLGFDRQHVMTLSYQRSLQHLAEADRSAAAAALRADLLGRVKSVPGVTDVAISTNASAPLAGGSVRYGITIPGIGATERADWPETRMVTPDYFRVMGMKVIRGRTFQLSDRAGTPLVMLINDVAARRFFPDRDPIGQTVIFRRPTTIIGILRGVHFSGPEAEVRPEMYTLADQEEQRSGMALGHLVVRTVGNPRGFAAAVREAVRPALPNEPSQPQFVDEFFRRVTAGRRFNAGLMATFGLIAVAIGAIGIYGTVAFVVAQHVRATGLRMALGASPSRVTRSVLWDALRPVGLGVGIGLAGAWAVSNAFAAFVFGIEPTDSTVYAGVGGFLAMVGFAAALVPAVRAGRLDPLDALRHE